MGVLMLAMGVGVLIGRSGSGARGSGAPRVITVGSGGGGASTGAAGEAFTDDWPAGTSGYTVQLQTLPKAGTTVAAVEAAKAAASAKGAKGVGALRSEDFSSLSSGQYLIYAGVYHSKAQASKALAGLRKRFPASRVVRVANGASSSSSSRGSSGAGSTGGSGAGSSLSHPAPPTVLESLKNTKGKSYEEKSKNLPDVVSTG